MKRLKKSISKVKERIVQMEKYPNAKLS